MPKAPILTRTAVFIPLRGTNTTPGVRDAAGYLPTFRRYEWNIVTTSLGQMLEAVASHARANINGGVGMTNEDVYETDFTDVKIMTLDQLAQIGAAGVNGGDTLPRDFSKLGLP